jgi:hypothetical protein
MVPNANAGDQEGFDSMTTAEKAVLYSEQERMIGEGYPEQTKRR